MCSKASECFLCLCLQEGIGRGVNCIGVMCEVCEVPHWVLLPEKPSGQVTSMSVLKGKKKKKNKGSHKFVKQIYQKLLFFLLKHNNNRTWHISLTEFNTDWTFFFFYFGHPQLYKNVPIMLLDTYPPQISIHSLKAFNYCHCMPDMVLEAVFFLPFSDSLFYFLFFLLTHPRPLGENQSFQTDFTLLPPHLSLPSAVCCQGM